FTIVCAGEIETNCERVGRLRFHHLCIIGAEIGPTFIAEQLPRKNYVSRSHGPAVRKTCGRINREGHETTRGVGSNAVSKKSVQRERLVMTAAGQTLDYVTRHIGWWPPFDDKRVEAIEGADDALPKLATLGRCRVDVGRMVEIWAPSGLAMHSQSVRGGLGACEPQASSHSHQQRAEHDCAPRCPQLRQR